MVSTRRGLPGRVEIDAARRTVDATVVARIAALPVAALAELRCTATWRSVREILVIRRRLADEGRRLADELEPVIGAVGPGPRRPALVALRRALYNARRPAGRAWPVEVGSGLAPRVADWIADLDRHDALVRRLPEELDQERRDAYEVLRRWVGTDAFGHGVLQAGPAMSAALHRWLAAPPGTAPPRQVALRLTRYLARVVAKTSPHATFMMAALGRWSDDGEPVRWEGAWAWRSAVEPNVPLLLRLLTDLARADDGLADLFVVRPNPSLDEDDGRLWYVTGQEDAYHGIAASEPLRRLLRPPYDDLRTRAGGALGRLLDLGVLELHPPVADQAAAHLADLTDRLGTHPAGKALAAAQEALARYPEAARVSEREALRRKVRSAFIRLAEDDADRLPDRNLFHENAVLTTPGPRLGLTAWRPALGDLHAITDFAALFDRDGVARLLAADLFARWFGAGARVPFGRFHRTLAERTRRAAPGTLAGELHALMYPWQERPPEGRTPAVPRLDELRDARAAALAAARGLLPQTPDPLTVDPAVLAGLTAGRPAFVRPVGSLSCFVQTIGPPEETPVRLVLNGLGPGHGAMRSRVHRLLRVAGVPAGENRPLGTERGVPVEITGLFGSNVNLRSTVAAQEIGYPGVVPSGPAVFDLRDLAVRHEPGAGGLVLTRAGHDTPLLPVYTGMVAPMLLPRTARLLLQLFGDMPSPVMGLESIFSRPPESVPARVERTARVSVGRVTVARAAWYVPVREIPRRGRGDSAAAHLLALAAWFAEHALPERCFVSSADPGAPARDRLRLGRLAKPTYLDLADPALVALFDRGLDASGSMVVFREPLPDLEAAADLGGGGDHPDHRRHVSEYVVEVGHA
ncbi:lantibiotic dehydratase [Streptosporangium sp. NPDC049046]|uniref:lantibiotic dehydratase n=1 Tax=Streptosporangium sp. NPDC049046 TaxID=3155031 RepID=UPI0034425530